MTALSDLEKSAIQSMISEHGFLWSGLCRYFAERAETYATACSSCMAVVPRKPEMASDYAARSDECRLTMAQLESFAKDL